MYLFIFPFLNWIFTVNGFFFFFWTGNQQLVPPELDERGYTLFFKDQWNQNHQGSCSPESEVLGVDRPQESVVKQTPGDRLRRLTDESFSSNQGKTLCFSWSGSSPLRIRAQDTIWWKDSILLLEVKTFRGFILNCVLAETWCSKKWSQRSVVGAQIRYILETEN